MKLQLQQRSVCYVIHILIAPESLWFLCGLFLWLTGLWSLLLPFSQPLFHVLGLFATKLLEEPRISILQHVSVGFKLGLFLSHVNALLV